MMQKVLSINYLFYFISKKDIFSHDCKAKNVYKYMLNTLVKQELLKLVKNIFLKSEKPS
jgi:hypothetical protein